MKKLTIDTYIIKLEFKYKYAGWTCASLVKYCRLLSLTSVIILKICKWSLSNNKSFTSKLNPSKKGQIQLKTFAYIIWRILSFHDISELKNYFQKYNKKYTQNKITVFCKRNKNWWKKQAQIYFLKIGMRMSFFLRGWDDKFS